MNENNKGSGGEEVSNKVIKDAKLNTASETKKSEPKRLKQTTGASMNLSAKTVLLAIGAVAVIIACVLVGYDMLKPKVVLTVNNEKLSLKDVGYYIYQGEQQGYSMAGIYQQFYGENYDYWNAEDEDGSTAGDSMATTVMDEISQDTVLYQAAVAKGYSATDDDTKTATKERDEIVKNLTKKQTMITGLSSDDLYNAILKKTVAARYKEDVIKGLDLDYDEITKDIKQKDYKQYDFEYYYVSTTTTDDQGNTKDLSDAEKEKLKKQMDELAKKAATAEDFAKLLADDEKTIQYTAEGQLIEKDGFDKKLDKVIKKMKVDEISEVLTGEEGYYIIKLKDNTSTESYDNAISEAKTTAEEEAFSDEYNNNILPDYTVEITYDVWDGVKWGSYCF